MNQFITKLLTTNIQGQLSGADIGGGICLVSAPGTGKTASTFALGAELNMQVVHMSLPEVSLENFSGLPDFRKAPEMDQYSTTGSTDSKATQWSVPEIIMSCNKAAQSGNGAILFLDDLHKIPKPVEPYLYSLLGERKLGNYKLDQRVAIVGAMNDSEEAGFEGIESPIKNRFKLLKVNFDFDYWFDNFGNRLHHYVSSFLKTQPSYTIETESTGIEQFGSARAWTQLANELDLYDKLFIDEHIQILARTAVSSDAAMALQKHVAYLNTIDFDSVVSSRAMQDISSLKELDKVLWAYIIHYIHTPEDAIYMMELINHNIQGTAVNNFIGFFASELYIKFLNKQDGKPISIGQSILLDKLLESYDASNYKLLTKTKKDLAILEFNNREELLNVVSSYIN